LSLVFRYAETPDLPRIAELLVHSFPGVGHTTSRWEQIITDFPHGGIETAWVAEENSRIVAMCRIYRLDQWISGVVIPIMGLGMVAISATDRRRGLAGRLVESALIKSRQRGDLASVLYPFRDSFYRKLGYGMAGEVQQFLLPPGEFPDHPGRKRVRIVPLPEGRELISPIYDQWAPAQTGQLRRSVRAWERVWEDGGRYAAVYHNESGDPEGYAVFHYRMATPTEGAALDIEEIIWLNREARLGLYGWISSLSDQWRQVIYRAHPDEAFTEHVNTLRQPELKAARWHHWFPTSVTLSGPMFRLLDVDGAWAARRVRPGPPLTVELEVTDPQIPGNEGRRVLTLADGEVRVAPEGGAADLRMSIGIEPLSRIYIGALTPSAAVLSGLATVDQPELSTWLDALLAVPRPWTFDRF
jgi:predicted acetyltransferase